MKLPTWGIIIGIFMVCFGGCSALGSLNTLAMREQLDDAKIEIKREFERGREDAKKEIDKDLLTDSLNSESTSVVLVDSTSTNTIAISEELSDKEKETIKRRAEEKEMEEKVGGVFEDLLNIDEATQDLYFMAQGANILFALFYLVAGIFLFIKKPISIKLVYFALGGYILYQLILFVLFLPGNKIGVLSFFLLGAGLLSIVIDIIFLVIVYFSDKTAYRFEESFED